MTGEFPAVTGEFPAQKPVTRNMFPFIDVIMKTGNIDIGDECSSMKCEVFPRRNVLMNKINSHPKEFGREPSSTHTHTGTKLQLLYKQAFLITLIFD